DQASTLSRCLQPPLPLEGGEGWGEGVISSDPVEECLGPARLVEPFWQMVGHAFAYRSEHPTLRDFAATLFRWANPLDAGVTLDPHAQVFLKRWQDSATHGPSFRAWAGLMEAELHVTAQLETLDDPKRIEAADTFPAFEKFFIHRLCRAFEAGATSPDLLPTLQQRRNSFWYPHHAGGYRALEQAIALRDGINAADLTLDSLDAGLARYVTAWHRIDTAYRRFCHHLRRYNQVALMERIAEWVEKTYVNSFLLPLADRWSDQVRGLTRWGCQQLPPQTAFFARFVQPYLDKGQKVVVVVSDALRFEAAADFAARLRAENRWTAEVHAMLGVLPSYTQLGMAALLPGQERRIQLPEGTVAVDGKSTAGTAARQQILATALNGRATALQTEAFMDLNTKTGARALLRDHEVVYLFHNRIDKVGDALATEAKTADAVEEAFEELLNLLRKIANANGNHMLLTADHGFLFQQSAVAEEDDQLLPEAGEWLFRNRRFALGRGIVPHPAAKIFSAPELGLPGDWSAAFPLALGRFPLQGSGKRYVHGGPSLQEVVVPVIRIHKARTDDIGRVEVEFLRLPARITTGQLALALYQDRPVADKVLGRTLRLGVYAADGTALSEARTLTFDSADAEPRNREQNVTLTLARAADRYNHQEVEIRLEETLAGTRQTAVYKSHRVKLHKPFASDFDDF
ncbi:MAG: BREX-1 system phosphatase PglZ type A, partial [Candidatus Contendobacter sp.]|nr:BREX-1 system phosphatase PglZ type A [Candidatus Contendobacter sp.]